MLKFQLRALHLLNKQKLTFVHIKKFYIFIQTLLEFEKFIKF